MRSSCLSLVLLLAAGCATESTTDSADPADSGSAENQAPVATITAPTGQSSLAELAVVHLAGTVADADDDATTLTARWLVNEVEVCAAAPVSADGTTSCDTTLPLGTVTITLEGADPDGATGTDTLVVTVSEDGAPTVSIEAPLADGYFYQDIAIGVHGTVHDAEDAPDALTIAWTDELGNVLSIDDQADSEGVLEGTTQLTKGSHTLTLTATDTAGKSGSASVELLVHDDNVLPDCAILSPVSGSSGSASDDVLLLGTVTDADVDSHMLGAKWTSDLDGVLWAETVASDGTTTTTVTGLSVGTHTITLRGKDEVEGECTATTVFIVGAGPEVVITAPTDGDVYNEGEALTFLAIATDTETAPEALVVEWADNLDGVLDVTAPDAAGTITFDTDTLSRGDHTVTLSVTDESGATTEATVDFTVNGLPTAPTISITPASPGTDDALSVSIDTAATDPDGDPLTFTYAWSVDGVASAYTSATLPASATTRGETWTATVTVSDGSGSSPSAAASTTVENTLPTVASATLTPDPAAAGDTLTCTAGTTADADGDTVATTIVWQVDGLATGDTGATLPGAAWHAGEIVGCTVTPNDGYGDGATVTSNLISVGNSAPSITGVAITPDPAATTDSLTCTSIGYFDADGDTEATTYEWTIGGAVVATGTTLASGSFVYGDAVTCTGTPSDGITTGTAMSTTVTIGNTAPVLASVSLTPSPAFAASTLTCTPGATTDADGTTSFTYTYGWTVNGAGMTVTTSTLGAGNFVEGDSVACLARPYDGASYGAWVTSTSVSIDNTAPEVLTVNLTPTLAYTNDTLTASVTSSDADAGDSVAYSYAWAVNGSAVASAGSTLGGAFFDRDDSVVVTVTPSDGTDSGTAVSSSALTISNSAPSGLVVSVSPTDPEAGVDDLTCTVDSPAADADGDSVSYTFTWTQNGSAYTGATDTSLSSAVPAGDTVEGDTFECSVTGTDGSATSAASTDSVSVVAAEYTIGSYAPYSSIGGGEPTGYLFAQKVTVSTAADLYELGKYTASANSNEFTMALYSDSASAPDALVAEAGTDTAAAGYQELAVSGAPVSLAAGDYWIAWQCSVANCKTYFSNAAADGASTNVLYYVSYTGYSAFPSTWPGGTSSTTGKIYNVYGVVR